MQDIIYHKSAAQQQEQINRLAAFLSTIHSESGSHQLQLNECNEKLAKSCQSLLQELPMHENYISSLNSWVDRLPLQAVRHTAHYDTRTQPR